MSPKAPTQPVHAEAAPCHTHNSPPRVSASPTRGPSPWIASAEPQPFSGSWNPRLGHGVVVGVVVVVVWDGSGREKVGGGDGCTGARGCRIVAFFC